MATNSRKRVLIIGEDPSLVDFSDPAIPKGVDEAKIRAGLAEALQQLRAAGRDADLLLTDRGETAAEQVERALAAATYDCIVIGAGIRIVPKMTVTFEDIVNVVRTRAPNARLAFNVSPADSAPAAERQLAK